MLMCISSNYECTGVILKWASMYYMFLLRHLMFILIEERYVNCYFNCNTIDHFSFQTHVEIIGCSEMFIFHVKF